MRARFRPDLDADETVVVRTRGGQDYRTRVGKQDRHRRCIRWSHTGAGRGERIAGGPDYYPALTVFPGKTEGAFVNRAGRQFDGVPWHRHVEGGLQIGLRVQGQQPAGLNGIRRINLFLRQPGLRRSRNLGGNLGLAGRLC